MFGHRQQAVLHQLPPLLVGNMARNINLDGPLQPKSRPRDRLPLVGSEGLDLWDVVDLGGDFARRVANDGSKPTTIQVPGDAIGFIALAESGTVRLEIGGVANATSTLFLASNGHMVYPIDPSQSLSTWGANGSFTNVRFLGVRRHVRH